MKKILLLLIAFLFTFTLTSCNKTNSKYDELYKALNKTENKIISENFNSAYGTRNLSVEIIDEQIKIRGSYYDMATFNNFIIIVYWEKDYSSMAIIDYQENVWWSQTEHSSCMEWYIKDGEVLLVPHEIANDRLTGIGSLFLDDANEVIKEKLGVNLRD